LFAPHDKRRLRDQRQALLDPVGEGRASGRQERTNADDGIVACGQREQRPRFPPCITQPAEELVARAAPLRIDRRTDEHHRPHAPRQAHGEFGDDLTAHRVCQERRALEAGRVQPPGKRGSKIRDAQWGARPLATPVARQVRYEHGEGGGERLREREHVAARDPVAVYEHDGRSFPSHARVDAEAGDFEPPALNRQTNTLSRLTLGSQPQRVRGSRHQARRSTRSGRSIIPTGRCWM